MPKKSSYELEPAAKPPEKGLVKVPAQLGEAREPSATRAAKDLAPFTRLDGEPMPAQEAWGALPYSELGPMFLDQFLLRYFIDLMIMPGEKAMRSGPWQAFVEVNHWARNMPQLFWQLTGYELSMRQKDAAIDDWVERMGKQKTEAPAEALTPEVVEHPHG